MFYTICKRVYRVYRVYRVTTHFRCVVFSSEVLVCFVCLEYSLFAMFFMVKKQFSRAKRVFSQRKIGLNRILRKTNKINSNQAVKPHK